MEALNPKLIDYGSKLVGLAIVTDFSKDLGCDELVQVLHNRKIQYKLININEGAKILLDPNTWDQVSMAFLLLSNENRIAFGSIQSLLELLGISYTGTGMLSAALSADLHKVKKIWQFNGIPTMPLFRWGSIADWSNIIELVGLPLAVKSSDPSDPRIFKISNLEQTTNLMDLLNGADLFIEPWVTGRLYLVYVINDIVLSPLLVDPDLTNPDQSNFMDQLAPELVDKFSTIKKLALEAMNAIGGQGLAEVQVLIDLNGDSWIRTVKFNLSLTKNSSIVIAANRSGLLFEELIDMILATSFIKKTSDLGILKVR